MNVINASYTVIQEPSISKKIESIARLCYKSEDKIKEGSDLKMINTLIKHQHTAMMEHGSMAFSVDHCTYALVHEAIDMSKTYVYDGTAAKRDYLRFSIHLNPMETIEEEDGGQTTEFAPDRYIISGNMRAWINALDNLVHMNCLPPALCNSIVENSNGIMDKYKEYGGIEEEYLTSINEIETEPVKFKAEYISDYTTLSNEERMLHEDISVLFTVDRGVTHEMVRMRECSFAQESTRYVNYTKGKFGSEITVVKPCFWPEDSALYKEWAASCQADEKSYFRLIELGATAQEARDVLPTSTKAEIVMTANLREWHHVLNLRACHATGLAHPQIAEIMTPLLQEWQNSDYAFAFADLTIPENK